MTDTETRVRIDKWLWAARFFKTRALAIEAIKLGRVQCNRARPKPSRQLQIGDRLHIEKGEQRFDVEVLGLSDQRGPAAQAQQLYAETPDSRERREAAAALRKAQRQSAPRPPHTRPDKHARQHIRRLIGK